MGWPPTKRGWPTAATMAVLTPATSVTIPPWPRPGGLGGHRTGRRGHERHLGAGRGRRKAPSRGPGPSGLILDRSRTPTPASQPERRTDRPVPITAARGAIVHAGSPGRSSRKPRPRMCSPPRLELRCTRMRSMGPAAMSSSGTQRAREQALGPSCGARACAVTGTDADRSPPRCAQLVGAPAVIADGLGHAARPAGRERNRAGPGAPGQAWLRIGLRRRRAAGRPSAAPSRCRHSAPMGASGPGGSPRSAPTARSATRRIGPGGRPPRTCAGPGGCGPRG